MAEQASPVRHNEKDDTWTAFDRKGKKLGDFSNRIDANKAYQESLGHKAKPKAEPKSE